MLDLSFSNLLAGFIFGVIGWWMAWKEGRRKGSPLLSVLGILLVVYPYFISNTLLTWLIGIAICAIAYKFWDS